MSTHTQEHNEHHEIGPKTLIIVWVVLTILTVVTVYIAAVDFGRALNIIVAMVIASVKASTTVYASFMVIPGTRLYKYVDVTGNEVHVVVSKMIEMLLLLLFDECK